MGEHLKFLPGVEKLWSGHEICTHAQMDGRMGESTKTIPISPTAMWREIIKPVYMM
jgi:hypothetical protein